GNKCKDSTLSFTSSVIPNAGNPTTWYWDFGGGQTITSTTSNVATYSYPATGTNILVRHSTTFTTGCNPDTIDVIIPVIYANPSASFSIITDTLCAKKPVQFLSTTTG